MHAVKNTHQMFRCNKRLNYTLTRYELQPDGTIHLAREKRNVLHIYRIEQLVRGGPDGRPSKYRGARPLEEAERGAAFGASGRWASHPECRTRQVLLYGTLRVPADAPRPPLTSRWFVRVGRRIG